MYTPTKWNDGDIVTAEKLNKMDNGWGAASVQLFSEDVITVDGRFGAQGNLVYSEPINADTITVTFNGTEYQCNRIEMGEFYAYGGIGENGPDFTEYPFAFTTDNGGETIVYTETAGTYTVAVSVSGIVTSTDFNNAVKTAGDGVFISTASASFEVVPGVTTWQEAHDAIVAGRYVYLVDGSGQAIMTHFIFASPVDYSIRGVQINSVGAESTSIAALSAESADGVLNY